MVMEEQFDDEEGMRRVQWARRKERMRREKQKQMLFRRLAKVLAVVLGVLIIILAVIGIRHAGKPAESEKKDMEYTSPLEAMENLYENVEDRGMEGQTDGTDSQEPDTQVQEDDAEKEGNVSKGYQASGNTIAPSGDIKSSYVIFVDLDDGEILMRREEKTRMNPASMTKILTLLVAVEHIDNLDDTFTMTSEIMDYCLKNDCSTAGFERDDTVTIRDLLYGTILPSGGEAALGLATYVAGSQEAFVDMMNERLEEMGVSETTHFTNCVGLYDTNHYSTAYDMAVIMENVMANDLCREVLSTRIYMTGGTKKQPDGIEISNLFLRRIEDKDVGNGEVTSGKTGYVSQSKHCAVSYGEDRSGKRYICVTAGAEGNKYTSPAEHAKIYKQFME